MDIKKRIDEIFPQLVEIRRDFHMHPELGMDEHRTSKKICEYLDQWGIEYTNNIANTGVVGIIRGGKSGKTVAIRADIDALPMEERNKVPYKSKYPGVMHACGHDAHGTILLGIAKILSEMRDEIKGNVKFFFQPAEETVGGALPMIEQGCMENPKVDYVTGLHVMGYLDVGKVELKYGKLNASSDTLDIKIQGKSCHGAYPENGIDAILVASNVVNNLQSITSRNISPLNSSVVSIGTINGGRGGNILANEVNMVGTMRVLDGQTRKYVKERIKTIVSQTCGAFGAKGSVTISQGYDYVINDSYVTDVIKRAATDVVGENNIVYKDFPSLGVEDFGYFANHAQGAFFHIGSRNKEKGIVADNHNNQFDIDEDCIKTGVFIQVKVAKELLGF